MTTFTKEAVFHLPTHTHSALKDPLLWGLDEDIGAGKHQDITKDLCWLFSLDCSACGGGYRLKGCHNCPEEKRNQEWQSNDRRISRWGNLTVTYVQLLFHALTRSQDPVPPQ